MNFNMEVGFVVEIEGKRILIETNEQSNDLTYFHDGVIYRGICVGQFIGIIRGPYVLVARVEKEFLDDLRFNDANITYNENRIRRKLEVSLLGYFDNKGFHIGIIAYPMIYNSAILLNDLQIEVIINDADDVDNPALLNIGKTVKERSLVRIDATKLFNTHIGIFGNTGSGKSNTLTKLYTELFNNENLDLQKSKFMFIDFNGEYTGKQVLSNKKRVISLSTKKKAGEDKISISQQNFWDIDTLAVLFSATEKTQKPFLKNAINYFLDQELMTITDDMIIHGVCSAFYNTFFSNSNKEANKLLHLIYDELDINEKNDMQKIPYYYYYWHEVGKSYYDGGAHYINKVSKEELIEERDELEKYLNLEAKSKINNLSITQRMKIAIYSHLIYCISYGHAQYDHINPLIERLKSRSQIIDKLISIEDQEHDESIVSVISLRNCNTEAKKMIPLLLVKNSYNHHKEINEDGINFTFHLVIDEAHNILSEQSIREEASWKDYRLETFEEIIKEGRKFGYYITLASQRPADISETIVSQLHNYFIHRLISDQDLRMINNTINTLDNVSKSNIPLLSQGQCILTGASYNLPKIIQIEKLDDVHSPNSESANLKRMWVQNNRI